jgi:hypothetical protein
VGLELADILRQFGPAYRQKYNHHLLPSHRQAMRAIERCRTVTLGGQVFRCVACEETRYSYHSCRNRHCPKCQHEQTQIWLEGQQALLLPVSYFLLTFTLPAELRELARANQKYLYDLLFRASARAVQQLAHDPRYVGGQIGLVGVLHTWTRNLFYHPHVHYLAPGGGLSREGQWLPAHNNFFLPVLALSKLFRAAFQHLLKKTPLYEQVPPAVWWRDWVVHCKAVGNGQAALKYLAPYIHRVALSNRRLVSCDLSGSLQTSRATFQYRTSDTGRLRLCSLSVEHFIQRFLQHILPRGFVKVRYYGFFGATRRSRLSALQHQLGKPPDDPRSPDKADDLSKTLELPASVLCPQCGRAMLFLRKLPPETCRSP